LPLRGRVPAHPIAPFAHGRARRLRLSPRCASTHAGCAESRIPSWFLEGRANAGVEHRNAPLAPRGCRILRRRREPAIRSAAALTHKIKRSHCYFSAAVVIGMQCESIRDRTVPISPSTQARRAANGEEEKSEESGKKDDEASEEEVVNS